jgi:hypothetical protein
MNWGMCVVFAYDESETLVVVAICRNGGKLGEENDSMGGWE